MSDSEVSDYSSSDEETTGLQKITKKQRISKFDNENDSSSDDDDDDQLSDNDLNTIVSKSKQTSSRFNDDGSSDEEDIDIDGEQEEEEEYDEDELLEKTANEIKKQLVSDTDKSKIKTIKVKKLTSKQLEKEAKRIAKTGVVYLSSIPPYMKPAKLRDVLSKFGEIGRIFLKPEDNSVYKKRIKTGGNKKKKFDEGWVEFVNKKDAKLCCKTLNGNIIGGKKGNFYYDDVMNLKYLKNFKWSDLTASLNREIDIKESKLQAELQQIHKINKTFVKNVETSKMLNNIQKQKKRKIDDDNNNDDNNDNKPVSVKRNFQQRSVTTNRSNADSSIKSNNHKSEGMNKLLSNIF